MTAVVDVLIQGFPGVSPSNGGIGWSTVGLVRTDDRIVLIDAGPIGARDLLRRRLAEHDLTPEDVTDLVLTHCHHDHSINWPMFPDAQVHISDVELTWGLQVPAGAGAVPEFSVRALAEYKRLVRHPARAQVVPGVVHTEMTPGHTPGGVLVSVNHGTDAAPARTIFLGDTAKNRAELACRRVDMTLDPAGSASSIELIHRRWDEVADTVVIPGHDLPLVRDDGGMHPVGERTAEITARLTEDFDQVTGFPLGDR